MCDCQKPKVLPTSLVIEKVEKGFIVREYDYRGDHGGVRVVLRMWAFNTVEEAAAFLIAGHNN